MTSYSQKYRRSEIGCYKTRIRAFCRNRKKEDPERLFMDEGLKDSFPKVFEMWKTQNYKRDFTPTVEKLEEVYSFRPAREVNDKNISKPVRATDKLLDDVKEFNSIAEAARGIGAKAANISACLKGRQKTVKGYEFEFIEI